MTSERTLSGEEIRAKACAEGLPPMVAMATQISTRLMGNIVAYRGSGPIPPGLYHSIFTGEARPKPVTEKAKSSNIGPQNGRIVAVDEPDDARNGRYQKNKEGEYELRHDTPPKGLVAQPLEISLRNIVNDLEIKYKLTEGQNPDDKGILRFTEIHDSPYVSQIIYSVNVNEVKPISQDILDSYKLVSNQIEENKKSEENKKKSTHDERIKHLLEHYPLDSLCPVYAQHPGQKEAKAIRVLGGIVRDCDIDFITDPPDMKRLLGTENVKKFLEPIDMSPHLPHDEKTMDHDRIKLEKLLASKAVDNMVYMLLEINNLRWKKYNDLKDAAIKEAKAAGRDFNLSEWKLANAHLKPFVPKQSNLLMMSAIVVTVGKGTPMQLYQALEINLIQQRILVSSRTHAEETKVNMENLDHPDRNISNRELLKLHRQVISHNKELIARSFIQHPSECHNEHYTSPRGFSVLVAGNIIKTEQDPNIAKFVRDNKQYIPINKQWINPSTGSENAEVWVEHFLRNEEMYRGKMDVIDAVKRFLENDKNIQFIVELQDTFSKELRELKDNYSKESGKLQDKLSQESKELQNKFSKESRPILSAETYLNRLLEQVGVTDKVKEYRNRPKTESKLEEKVETRAEKNVEEHQRSTIDSNIEEKVDKIAETKIDSKSENVDSKTEEKVKKISETNVDSTTEPEVAQRAETIVASKTETDVGQRAETKANSKTELEVSQRAETKANSKTEPEVSQRAETNIALKTKIKIDPKTETIAETKSKTKMDSKAGRETQKKVASLVLFFSKKQTQPNKKTAQDENIDQSETNSNKVRRNTGG
jgi:hypothetical protein